MTTAPQPLSPVLLRHLADMLPEVIYQSRKRLAWTYSDDYEWVRPTEHAYLVSLAEAKLTEEQQRQYLDRLCSLFTCGDGDNGAGQYWFAVIHADEVQRLTALCKVLGKENP